MFASKTEQQVFKYWALLGKDYYMYNIGER